MQEREAGSLLVFENSGPVEEGDEFIIAVHVDADLDRIPEDGRK